MVILFCFIIYQIKFLLHWVDLYIVHTHVHAYNICYIDTCEMYVKYVYIKVLTVNGDYL